MDPDHPFRGNRDRPVSGIFRGSFSGNSLIIPVWQTGQYLTKKTGLYKAV
jgi:hypothetical protein